MPDKIEKLKGFQKKYLRGLAHKLKPVVLIGRNGLTGPLIKSADQALEKHELIKIKFNEFKDKDQKTAISSRIEKETGSEVIGTIGHTVIFFRHQNDPEKRTIVLPRSSVQS